MVAWKNIETISIMCVNLNYSMYFYNCSTFATRLNKYQLIDEVHLMVAGGFVMVRIWFVDLVQQELLWNPPLHPAVCNIIM